MLENCKTALERWGGISDIIDRWLEERQQLLIDYCSLSEGIEELDNKRSGQKLQSLCQILVDYVSAGHFEIFEQLKIEGKEFNDEAGLKTAEDLFAKIGETTEFILDFNDKYQETDDLDAIENDLSQLGEVLAHRFEMEDGIIDVLHLAHKEQALPVV